MRRRQGIPAALAALLTGCSAVEVLDALVPQDTYRGRTGIAYGADPRQKVDIYQPLRQDKPAPVVVFFYGGNWTRGERADYRFVGEALAARGVVVVVADYRLSPQVRWQDILRDCAMAVRWTFDNATAYGGDPARIHLMGHSAGAYNAAMLALDPRWLATQQLAPARLAGWIGVAGPYDFLPIHEPRSQVAFGWPNTPADSQPIRHANPKAPRTLLLAAAKDEVVDPVRSTVWLGRALEAAGVPVRVRLFERVGHPTVLGALARPLRRLAPVLDEVLTFVGAPPPNT
ncbi:alpha/beta hydrolase [Ramlibacter terrae]|uniref:Alpha/beta hydrolase n=1 Tax=Ramlibacter terrae TaxID=2732511 RepID=A0ABX6P653_9BURK|nr:alpha/beta hydrolase [Ramlibacter terrae]